MNTITYSIFLFPTIILVIFFLLYMYLYVKNKQNIKREQQEEINRRVREDTLKKYEATKAALTLSQKQ